MTKKAAMNNFRHILTTLLLVTGVVCARGEGIFDNLTYYGRLGYSLGGDERYGHRCPRKELQHGDASG